MNTYGTVRIEALGADNYDTWKIQMKALLIKNDAWGYVGGANVKPEPTTNNAAAVTTWVEKDEKAKSDLILSNSTNQLKLIKNCATFRELWLKLEETFASKGPARKVQILVEKSEENWRRFRFYVYSAYVERRTVAAVRVIAATKTRGSDAVICRMWLPDNRTLTLKARVKPIRENWNLKYSATYVLCLLRDSGVKPQETVGASLSVLANSAPNRPPTNLLTVLDTEPKSGIEETLHVCVKPFHFSYSRDVWLLEWFELNRLLGVSHFYMYNESLSSPVACLLEHYRKQGLVTLLPWKLPIVSKVEIRTEGQFAAFNDCLYRSMSSAGWLLVIDVDEVVVPRRERTLAALLTALRAAYNPPSKAPSAFLFRNAFFYLRWEDDIESPADLVTARKTRRWASPHALKNRSKYALRPRDAIELGNHFVWELAPGASSVGVPTERALLHHYRIACEYGGVQCLTVPSTVDRTAHRWSDVLLQRVKEETQAYTKTCQVSQVIT